MSHEITDTVLIYGFTYSDDVEGRYTKQGEHFFLNKADALTAATSKFGSVTAKYLHPDIKFYETLVGKQARERALAKLTEAEKKLLGLL